MMNPLAASNIRAFLGTPDAVPIHSENIWAKRRPNCHIIIGLSLSET
jgi:hypothetical protein